ncbi:hypothetical protein [Spirosoma radiotolerans]|uniref:TonB-dependent receptor plug domain-containing protein n=1 Tax=Spirosoma radiotolerans TaxID=1379870 RepID=A0A0E3ZRP5_9BACT|nr:hypothetical protein [Spirosoma radiotolerans]AKD53760.1 hypothetical protein SD10_01430 [Spirosoma radiotolerans]
MIGFLNYALYLTSTALMWAGLMGNFFSQHTQNLAGRSPVFIRARKGSIIQSDTLKKQSAKLHTKSVHPAKQASETRYSAPGHYTVTVPRENTPGGKADLILVNGTKQVDRIGDVDSNTIESIELLKDTKSIAKYKLLYGEKAAKGIVIIHLKGTNTL